MPAPQANGRPRAVVFDLGGVLLDWNPRYLYRKLFAGDNAAMERFLADVCTMEWHHAHDLGIPPEETCPPLAAEHPDLEEMIWAWVHRSEEMLGGPIEETVEILRALKDQSVPCYALTNMETWTYPGRVERFPFLTWFDGTVVSGFEGVAKPDVRVFELLLDRFELDRRARSSSTTPPPTWRRLAGPDCRRSSSSRPSTCEAGSSGPASVFLCPAPSPRVLPLDKVEQPPPPARLDAGLGLAPRGRATPRRGQRSGGRGVDPQVDSTFVQRGDLIGGDETLPVLDPHHDPVEDVLLGCRHDVVDRADLLAT